LPSKTLLLDLTLNKEKLFDQLKKDARYPLRKSNQLSVISYQLNNIKKFRETWSKSVGLKRYIPKLENLLSLKKVFKDKSLFITDVNKNSGAIFLISDKTAYYWQAFTNKEGRKAFAQYKIVWEGILWAVDMGAKVFDFEGIYDERFPNKSWLGFSHFKKSFGGRVVEYPGAFVKLRFPI
jgi:lipid II:glycine glycyltransferase (peptidoglycan interpeptide bridge formation enzyme)